MSDLWTIDELKASMEAYLQMLEYEQTGKEYKKADIYRKLRAGELSGRTTKSLGRRMSNLTWFFASRGLPTIESYKPLSHVGTNVVKKLDDIYLEISK